MAPESNFFLVWLVYLTASGVFYSVFWLATGFKQAIWSSYSLRAVAAAVILTPWYANIGGETMAPALMVMTLDLITIGSESVSRAAVPLMVSILTAELAATALFFLQKRRSTNFTNSENSKNTQ